MNSEMKYLVIYAPGENSVTASVPDLNVIATAPTFEEAKVQIREAVEFHVDCLREKGWSVPEPAHQFESLEVAI